ncbi:hypothetical protein D915_003786 [Fasciola hepatica]|uniref:Uncharacterized protein n=1 Tax=Fasciola hepatica TaxID=6192 RepID=A0A4E0S001_FASHE|nr:hypothetical protein D915_003786 [Fasciola hepatica]
MAVSVEDYPQVSKKWYKGLMRNKHEQNNSRMHQPYIFSYEDPSLHADYKPLYNPDAHAHFGDGSEPINAQKTIASAFEYSDTKTPITEYTAQYETIFTYAEPLTVDPLLTNWTEEAHHKDQTTFKWSVSFLLIVLSTLLLILLFPILCWIYIKRIARNERLVVIRLGERLRTKGPGFVVTLPFCDQSHRLLLDDQTLSVGPVSGRTRDQGEVEIHCEFTYRINDPDCIYASSKKSPSQTIVAIAETCMTAALGHLTWPELEEGGGKQDVTNEIVVSLNCLCGVHGLQIVRADCTGVTLTCAPPSPETLKRSNLSVVQKQLQNLTSLFFPSTNRGSTSKPAFNLLSNVAPNTNPKPPTSGSSSSVTRGLNRSHSLDVPHSGTTDVNEEESVSRTRLLSLRLTDLSATRAILCSQVIARAQPFLSNDLVCLALDRATLQLVIGSDRITEPLPSLSEAAADEARYSVLYLDAKAGRSTMGALPDPEVTVFVNVADLSEILTGRLGMKKAITEGRVVVQGNTKALDKLRHLLFLHAE